MVFQGLKAFRKRHRIQLQELAKASKIAPSSLSRIENGWAPLTPSAAKKLEAGYERLEVDASGTLEHLLAKGQVQSDLNGADQMSASEGKLA